MTFWKWALRIVSTLYRNRRLIPPCPEQASCRSYSLGSRFFHGVPTTLLRSFFHAVPKNERVGSRASYVLSSKYCRQQYRSLICLHSPLHVSSDLNQQDRKIFFLILRFLALVSLTATVDEVELFAGWRDAAVRTGPEKLKTKT